MSLLALSTEVQQNIIGYIDFISLLNVRNTNTVFRDLVNASLLKPTVIPPAHVKLLELYQELGLPLIYANATHDNNNNQREEPIDGEEYLSTLRAQIAQYAPQKNLKIPPEFESWVLESPEHALLGFSYLTEIEENEGEKLLASDDAGTRFSYLSAEEDADLVGIYLGYHGCTIYTTFFFDGAGERTGKVWKGDICEMTEIESWEENAAS